MRKEKYKKLSSVAEFTFSSGKQFLAFHIWFYREKNRTIWRCNLLMGSTFILLNAICEICVLRKYYKSYMNFLNNFLDKINCNKVNKQGRVWWPN